MTACEGPDGNYHDYGALPCGDTPGPIDDATIAPYGAGSSIAFLPAESISTLKHYFQNTDIFRYLFGFGDAYNPSNATVTAYYNGSWYNHSYFGIDQGPMLIMIENYRSGLIWKYFMQNGDIQKALLTIFPTATSTNTIVYPPFIYPNPYYGNKHNYIYFGDVTENSIIQIFTIAGELVREIRVESSPQRWDVRNSAGEKIASGIYIYLIKDPAGNKKVGKLGVIK